MHHHRPLADQLLLSPVLTPLCLPFTFTCYRPGPPLDRPRWTPLNFMTPLAIGHLPTPLEDEIGRLTDHLKDRLLLRPAPPRTYTNTVRPARSPPSSTRRDAPLPPIATERLGRTQVIRRREYGMTERDIIQTMTKQTGIPGHRLFESVLHDPMDRRRFYLTNATMTVKRDVMGRGFFVGGIHIRPIDDAIEGYIPCSPFYCGKQTMGGLLNASGQLWTVTLYRRQTVSGLPGTSFEWDLDQTGLYRRL